jgi:hypothetical protein
MIAWPIREYCRVVCKWDKFSYSQYSVLLPFYVSLRNVTGKRAQSTTTFSLISDIVTQCILGI